MVVIVLVILFHSNKGNIDMGTSVTFGKRPPPSHGRPVRVDRAPPDRRKPFGSVTKESVEARLTSVEIALRKARSSNYVRRMQVRRLVLEKSKLEAILKRRASSSMGLAYAEPVREVVAPRLRGAKPLDPSLIRHLRSKLGLED